MQSATEDSRSEDPLKRRSFTVRDQIRRLVWNVFCALFFRPSPTRMHGYRCGLLRLFGANIGRSNYIYPSAKIWAPWLLETADVVTLGPACEVYNPGGIQLGHHTIISQGAYLCGATHDYNSFTFDYIKKPITTEAYVWICARAIVLPGVHCDVGSVLGAGSVATRSLEPWGVYAGNPAKKVKDRNQFDVLAPDGTSGDAIQ